MLHPMVKFHAVIVNDDLKLRMKFLLALIKMELKKSNPTKIEVNFVLLGLRHPTLDDCACTHVFQK